MNNVHFQSRPARLKLGETIGLKAPASTGLRLRAYFPDQAELRLRGQDTFKSGQTIETWLRPFEVAMWELIAQGMAAKQKGWGQRDLPEEKLAIWSQRLALESGPVGPDMEIYFADPSANFRSPARRPTLKELERDGFEKWIIARRGTLPPLA